MLALHSGRELLQGLEQRLQRTFRLDPRGTLRDVKEFHDSGIKSKPLFWSYPGLCAMRPLENGWSFNYA
jgi:hypothetical protein